MPSFVGSCRKVKCQYRGRGRGDSLAELGITEEEFEEYAQRKPRGENPESGTLAMGMDVDPSQAPRQGGSRLGKLTE